MSDELQDAFGNILEALRNHGQLEDVYKLIVNGKRFNLAGNTTLNFRSPLTGRVKNLRVENSYQHKHNCVSVVFKLPKKAG